MNQDPTFIAYVRARQAHVMEELRAPGYVRPNAAALRLPIEAHIGDCQYVDQDESVIRDATKRLTFVHRIDHSPEVDDWALMELEFAADHVNWDIVPTHVKRQIFEVKAS